MRKIPLTKGKYALIDDEDFEQLNRFRWAVQKGGNTFYAVRHARIKYRRCGLLMHRAILGLEYKDGVHTDHIDGNGLNNQRSNIRMCTQQQNLFNRKSNKGSSSKYKGIYWDAKKQRWRCRIVIDGEQIHIGTFKSEILAAKAYDEKAKELHGEFAKLNF